jgi:septation ring formation regulator EzrA
MALEEAFSDQKDILARTTERELKFKHEVQSLSQQLVYADENKQLVAQYEDKLKENDKSIDEMSEDIRNREIK